MPTINIHPRLQELGVKSSFITSIAGTTQHQDQIDRVINSINRKIDQIVETIVALNNHSSVVSGILSNSRSVDTTLDEKFNILYEAACTPISGSGPLSIENPSQFIQIQEALSLTSECNIHTISNMLGQSQQNLKNNIDVLHKAACTPISGNGLLSRENPSQFIQIQEALSLTSECSIHAISNMLSQSREHLQDNINALHRAACTPISGNGQPLSAENPSQLIQIQEALSLTSACDIHTISNMLGQSREHLQDNINALHRAACTPISGNGQPLSAENPSQLIHIQKTLNLPMSKISSIIQKAHHTHIENTLNLFDEDVETLLILCAGPDNIDVILEDLKGNDNLKILSSTLITRETIKHIRSEIIVRTPEELGVKEELVMPVLKQWIENPIVEKDAITRTYNYYINFKWQDISTSDKEKASLKTYIENLHAKIMSAVEDGVHQTHSTPIGSESDDSAFAPSAPTSAHTSDVLEFAYPAEHIDLRRNREEDNDAFIPAKHAKVATSPCDIVAPIINTGAIADCIEQQLNLDFSILRLVELTAYIVSNSTEQTYDLILDDLMRDPSYTWENDMIPELQVIQHIVGAIFDECGINHL